VAKLSDAELLAAISAAEATALGSVSGAVMTDRADAQSRYYGRAYGDEQPGRSSVVSRDVADVVEGVVANVVKPIVSGDHVVEFAPVGPDDEERAEQETSYCNFVALERNNGFVWIVSAVKDALLLRTGYIKAGWVTRSDVVTETYQALSEEEVGLLLEDKDVEVVEHSEYPDPMGGFGAAPGMAGQAAGAQAPQMAANGALNAVAGHPGALDMPMLHDVKVKRTKPTEYVGVDPVPPDEVLVSERARSPSLQDADFVQHRTHKTLSELRQAGYKVDDDITDDEQGDTIENISRTRFNEGGAWQEPTLDNARKLVLFKESYIRVDRNGDGVAELRRVCSVGENILADDDCDIIPIACFSGVLVPHQHLGMSVYDLVEDLAKIKTALMRSYLDNRYLQNNGRYAVNADLVNIDDFLVSRPGGVVRVSGDPGAAILPLVAPDTSTGALQGLEYLDSVREQRTGYTRNSAGIDNDALTNRTATGMGMQLSQSQLRLEMIARTIVETGLKDTFRIIHALTLQHSTREEKFRRNGKWISVNPREWVRRNDLSVSLGLGMGTPEQQLGKLMALMPLLQQGQMMGLVGVQQAYNYASEAFKLSGYKAPDRFLKAPQVDPQTGQPKEPTPPPPEAVQVEQMRQQGKQQELQANSQMEMAKIQMQAQAKDKEQQNALVVQQQNDQRDAMRAEQQAQLDMVKQERDHQLRRDEMLLKHQLEVQKHQDEMAFKYHAAAQQDDRERMALGVQASGQDRQATLAERTAAAKEQEVAVAKEQKKPVKGYKVIRGSDGRAAQLDVIN